MIRSESVGPAGRPDVAGGVGPAVRIPGPAPAGRGEPAAVQVVEAVILLMDDDEPFDLRDFVAGGGVGRNGAGPGRKEGGDEGRLMCGLASTRHLCAR